MESKHHKQSYQHKETVRRWTFTLVTTVILYAVANGPAVAASSATGDMSLLTMQRIKSYVDDTCTLDPHCQWTWDTVGQNVLRNVSVEEASAMMPDDYMFPPGNDAEKPGQRGECSEYEILLLDNRPMQCYISVSVRCEKRAFLSGIFSFR